MGSFLSDIFFKSFSSTLHMFISIFMIQILQLLKFSDIDRNYLLGNRKKIATFLLRTFTVYLPLYLPACVYRFYAKTIFYLTFTVCIVYNVGALYCFTYFSFSLVSIHHYF
jgi:hypothetical protein